MQSETGFPSSHQLKSYVASNFRLKLAARAVLSADAGLLVVENFNRLSRAHERYRQTDDRLTAGDTILANVQVH